MNPPSFWPAFLAPPSEGYNPPNGFSILHTADTCILVRVAVSQNPPFFPAHGLPLWSNTINFLRPCLLLFLRMKLPGPFPVSPPAWKDGQPTPRSPLQSEFSGSV